MYSNSWAAVLQHCLVNRPAEPSGPCTLHISPDAKTSIVTNCTLQIYFVADMTMSRLFVLHAQYDVAERSSMKVPHRSPERRWSPAQYRGRAGWRPWGSWPAHRTPRPWVRWRSRPAYGTARAVSAARPGPARQPPARRAAELALGAAQWSAELVRWPSARLAAELARGAARWAALHRAPGRPLRSGPAQQQQPCFSAAIQATCSGVLA